MSSTGAGAPSPRARSQSAICRPRRRFNRHGPPSLSRTPSQSPGRFQHPQPAPLPPDRKGHRSGTRPWKESNEMDKLLYIKEMYENRGENYANPKMASFLQSPNQPGATSPSTKPWKPSTPPMKKTLWVFVPHARGRAASRLSSSPFQPTSCRQRNRHASACGQTRKNPDEKP